MKKIFAYSILLVLILPLSGKYFIDKFKINSKDKETRYYSGPNFRILPDTIVQVEISAYTHPLDHSIKVASAITDYFEGGYSSGFYITSNNGVNWSGTDNIKTAAGTTITTVGDPVIVINQNGNFIMTYVAFGGIAGNILKVGASVSTNNGVNWSPTIYIPGVDTCDKPISETDNATGSPFLGRTYMAYDELKLSGEEIKGVYLSYSTDGGFTWDSAKRVTNIDVNYKHRLICDIAIGEGGEVFLFWYSNRHNFGIAKSTNGGVSWIQNTDNAIASALTEITYEYNDIYLNGVPSMEIDNSGGVRDGWIYTVNVGLASDSLDIVLHRSTDGGSSWAYSTRVNQDISVPRKVQSMPAMHVDEYGGINIMYLDTRNSILNDSMEVYLSRSTDGGNSFYDTKISDHKFKLSTTAVPLFYFKGYIGSYTGLTSGNGRLTPVWFDNSQGHYQAFSTLIELLPTFEVKVFPEGFYNDATQGLNMKDTIKVYLRNSFSPFQIVDSSKGLIDSVNFASSLKFSYELSPGNYYLDIRHRNSIQTWSAAGVTYSFGSIVNYDFTSVSASAYGDNMKLVDSKWGIYSGDTDQDGLIDLSDVLNVSNGANVFLTGYAVEDCNGDSIVDLMDLVIVFNNAQMFVSVMTP